MAHKLIDLIIDSNNRITGASVVPATTKTGEDPISAKMRVSPGQSVHRVEILEEFIGHSDFDRVVSGLLHFEGGVAKIKSIKK
jgi:hypothetical protein